VFSQPLIAPVFGCLEGYLTTQTYVTGGLMSLKKLFKLQNEGPERIPTLPVRKKAGMGPLSNGVPERLPYGARGVADDAPPMKKYNPGEPIETGIEPDAVDQTIPVGRPNRGGSGQP